MKHLLFAIVFGLTGAACASGWNGATKPVKEPGLPCGRVWSYCGPDIDGTALCCAPEYSCGGCRPGYCCPKPLDSGGSAFGGLVGAKPPVPMTREKP